MSDPLSARYRWHILATVERSHPCSRAAVYLCDSRTKEFLGRRIVTDDLGAERFAHEWAAKIGIPLDDIEMQLL